MQRGLSGKPPAVVNPSLVDTSRSSNAADTALPASPLKVITYLVRSIRPDIVLAVAEHVITLARVIGMVC